MLGHFDPFIVCLSVLASILAVYVAFDLTGRVAASSGAVRSAWMLAGALATGVGMWTMHLSGMLALRLPVTVAYTVQGVLLALAIAVAASIVSLLVAATQGSMSFPVLAAGCLLGIGMGAMHVVAMGAMRMAAVPVLDNRTIVLSMVIAVVAGVALVSFASRLRSDEGSGGWRRRLVASLVIGALIASMHYTAMAGTTFMPASVATPAATAQLLATHGLAYTVVASCVSMVLLALGGAAVDRALQRRASLAIAPQVASHGLHYARLQPDGDVAVYCDPDKAEQVLLNLLSNAVKFTPPGGRIEVQSRAGDRVARISVSDSGAGIAEDKLEAIFEPFVQVERSLTSPSEGAGLGLAISRDLARAMGGELRVRSTVGEGSVFTFELPLVNTASSRNAPAAGGTGALRLEA